MFVEPQVKSWEDRARVTMPDGSSEEVPVFVAHPNDGTPVERPGLLLIQEAFGVNAHIRDLCCRYARQGYVVVSPDLYHRTGEWQTFSYTDFGSTRPAMQRLTEADVLADLQASLHFLAEQENVDPARLGMLGYCMGGRLSYLGAAAFADQIKAVAVYYGGGITGNQPLPGFPSAPIERTNEIRAPLIAFFGGQDPSIPQEAVAQIDRALQEARVRHAVYLYPEAGHGFFCDARESFSTRAAEDAWHRTLQWFEDALGPIPCVKWE